MEEIKKYIYNGRFLISSMSCDKTDNSTKSVCFLRLNDFFFLNLSIFFLCLFLSLSLLLTHFLYLSPFLPVASSLLLSHTLFLSLTFLFLSKQHVHSIDIFLIPKVFLALVDNDGYQGVYSPSIDTVLGPMTDNKRRKRYVQFQDCLLLVGLSVDSLLT